MGGDALFQLFAAALAEPGIAEAACRQLLAQMLGPDMLVHWGDLSGLKPVQSLARVVACAVPGSGSTLRDPGLWRSALGDEADCRQWWLALLARHRLCGEGASVSPEEFHELVLSAFRALRDRYASEDYLRNLRTTGGDMRRLWDRYEQLELVSWGPLGTARRCRSLLSRDERSCQQIRKGCLAASIDQVRAEVSLLRGIEHPNLPTIVESFEDFHSFYIVSEVAGGTPLMQFLKAQCSASKPINESWLAQVVRQILEVLRHCHGLRPLPMVHGDLRPESLSLASGPDQDSKPHAVVSDLALAGLVAPPPPPRLTAPTALALAHSSPAAPAGEPPSPARDVWCCGALLYLLLAGGHPCGEGLFGRPLFPAALPYRGVALAPLQHASTGAESLCTQMLTPDPQSRPSAAECLEHPWLDDCLLPTHAKHLLPLQVLEGLCRRWEDSELRCRACSQAVEELGCGALARGGPDNQALSPLASVTPEEARTRLSELSFTAASADHVVQAYRNAGGGVALGLFAAGCEELAEALLDASIWPAFLACGGDSTGVLSRKPGRDLALDEAAGGDPVESALRTALSEWSCGGSEVTFEALRELVIGRLRAPRQAGKKTGREASPAARPARAARPSGAIRFCG